MSYVEKLLGEDEEVVHVSHQHWLVIAPSLLGMAFIASFIVGAVIAVYTLSIGVPLVPAPALLIFLIFPLGKAAIDWLRWRNAALLVTNRRVIHVQGVLSKNVLDSSLDKVNDIALEQSLWGRLLDYGDVEILTASEFGANRFARLAQPVKCKTAMVGQKTALEQGAVPVQVMDVPTQIAKLAALREKGIITDAEFEGKKVDLLRRM